MRRAARAAIAGATLACLVACGADEPDPALDVLKSPAAQETTETETAEDGRSDDPESGEDGEDVPEEVSEAEFMADLEAAMAREPSARVEMTAGGEFYEMTMDYGVQPPRMRMLVTTLGASEPFEVRSVDGIVYLNLGARTGDKFWRIDPSQQSGELAELLDLTSSGDIRQQFAEFSDAVRTVTFLGDEDVLGARRDHYVLAADTKKLKDVTAEERRLLGPTTEYHVWLDDDSLMRRLEITVGGVTVRMDMDRWGDPVKIVAPPAGQVIEPPAGFGQ